LFNANKLLDEIEDVLKERKFSKDNREAVINGLTTKIAQAKIAEFINTVMDRFRIVVKTKEVTLDILDKFMRDDSKVPTYLEENRLYLRAEDYSRFRTNFETLKALYREDNLSEVAKIYSKQLGSEPVFASTLDEYAQERFGSLFAYINKRYEIENLKRELQEKAGKEVTISLLNFSLAIARITLATGEERSKNFQSYKNTATEIESGALNLLHQRVYLEILRSALIYKSKELSKEEIQKYFRGDNVRDYYQIGKALVNHFPKEWQNEAIKVEDIKAAIDYYQSKAYNTNLDIILKSISLYREYIRYLRDNPQDITLYLASNWISMVAMNAVSLLQMLISRPDERQIEEVKEKGFIKNINALDEVISDKGKKAFISGQWLSIKEQRHYIGRRGSFILTEVITEDGKRYFGYYPLAQDKETIDLIHNVIYREDLPNMAIWIEVTSLPTDVLDDVYDPDKEQKINFNTSALIPLGDIFGGMRLDYSTIINAPMYGDEQDIEEHRVGVTFTQVTNSGWQFNEGAALFINEQDGDDNHYSFFVHN